MTPFAIFLICLGLFVILFPLSIWLTPRADDGGEPLHRSARFFLVALRLAIGWHFLTEGLEKLNNPAWSGDNYLRVATGPLAGYFRGVADEDLLAKLSLANGQFPEALDKEWQRYRDQFAEDFKLTPEQRQQADIKLDQAKKETLEWMSKKQTIKKLSPYVDRTDDMTVAERLAYYHKLVDQIDTTVTTQGMPYGAAAEDKVKQARDEADYIVKDLKKDLAARTAEMKQQLASILTKEQQRYNMPPVPRPPYNEWSQLQWSDHIVPWALTSVGGLLLVGLLTRPACLAGALWMLMLYLTMMPLPGWPDPPRTEGHYLFINKNLIEMLALLVLATVPSGRWLGLDSLFGLLFTRRRKTVAHPRALSPRAPGKEPTAPPVSAS